MDAQNDPKDSKFKVFQPSEFSFREENTPQQEVPEVHSPESQSPQGQSPEVRAPQTNRPQVPNPALKLTLEALRSEQSLAMGVFAGFVAAIAGAAAWGLVTAYTEYQIGYMAIGIGFLVGFAVRLAGKGVDPSFGVLSAVLSLLGCVLGNLWTMTYFLAAKQGIPFLKAVSQLNPDIAVNIMVSTFNYMDVLFYGLALYFGYKYGFRQINEDELKQS
jgi:hypothetical protein